jgi:hypothetical protein
MKEISVEFTSPWIENAESQYDFQRLNLFLDLQNSIHSHPRFIYPLTRKVAMLAKFDNTVFK